MQLLQLDPFGKCWGNFIAGAEKIRALNHGNRAQWGDMIAWKDKETKTSRVMQSTAVMP
jgi:uncharacterized membrane protein